jgi:hypothetical protein
VELGPLARFGVHPPVVDAGADDLDLARAGRKLAGWGVAVAAHQPVATLVVGGQVNVDLGLQRSCQHPARALTGQLVQAHRQLTPGSLVCDYTQHRGVPSSPALASPASFQHGQGGRYAAFSRQGLIHKVSTISRWSSHRLFLGS